MSDWIFDNIFKISDMKRKRQILGLKQIFVLIINVITSIIVMFEHCNLKDTSFWILLVIYITCNIQQCFTLWKYYSSHFIAFFGLIGFGPIPIIFIHYSQFDETQFYRK